MRRKDREITDFDEIVAIMRKCDVCRLALNDGDFPYIVPLNFGLEVRGDRVFLYFHAAKEGKKLDLIARDNRATFERQTRLTPAPPLPPGRRPRPRPWSTSRG